MMQSARIGTLVWYINGTFYSVRPYPDSLTERFFCVFHKGPNRGNGLAGLFGTSTRQYSLEII